MAALQVPFERCSTSAGSVLVDPDTVDLSAGLFIEANDGNILLIALNDSGSAATVTITPQADLPGGLSIADLTVVIGAGETRVLGPFPPVLFNDELQRVLLAEPSGVVKFLATGL